MLENYFKLPISSAKYTTVNQNASPQTNKYVLYYNKIELNYITTNIITLS